MLWVVLLGSNYLQLCSYVQITIFSRIIDSDSHFDCSSVMSLVSELLHSWMNYNKPFLSHVKKIWQIPWKDQAHLLTSPSVIKSVSGLLSSSTARYIMGCCYSEPTPSIYDEPKPYRTAVAHYSQYSRQSGPGLQRVQPVSAWSYAQCFCLRPMSDSSGSEEVSPSPERVRPLTFEI